MALARITGDTQAEHMARQTLTEQLHLLDPTWGGVYQYSMGSDWNSPHFEKIMQMQAENLRIYSLAYAQWGDPAYLHAAQEIRRYLKTFLTSPEGAFYTSQDADLIEGHNGAENFDQFRSDPAFLPAAQEIRLYLKTFLTSPEGAFYTSQDADWSEVHHGAEYFDQI